MPPVGPFPRIAPREELIPRLRESALSWPAFLSFLAIFIAGMQGTLVMESTDPCRISFRKLLILLGLELLEVIVIIASEIFSFINLKHALRERLTWLQWTPPCLLVIGILELFLDVSYTLMIAAVSRIEWLPFSSTGPPKPIEDAERRLSSPVDGVEASSSTSTQEQMNALMTSFEETTRNPIGYLLYVLLNMCLSAVLIGWRQEWWWSADQFVSEDVARARAREESSLRVGVVAFAVGWAIVCYSSIIFNSLVLSGATGIKKWMRYMRHMFCPHKVEKLYFENVRDESNRNMDEVRRQYSILIQFQTGETVPPPPNDNRVEDCVRQAPLHIGNAVIGYDKENGTCQRNKQMGVMRVILLLYEHLSVLPLLVIVVVAVSRLWRTVDEKTLEALEELSDVVIIVSLLEVAITLKNMLWATPGYNSQDKADRPLCDKYILAPRHTPTPPGTSTASRDSSNATEAEEEVPEHPAIEPPEGHVT